MHTGVVSSGVVWHVFSERYTRVLMDASPEFPIHFLKIYSTSTPLRPLHMPQYGGASRLGRHGVAPPGLCRALRHATTSRSIQTVCTATAGHNSIPTRCTTTPR